MTEKFEVIVAKKKETTANGNEMKEEKKSERFDMFTEMQKKSLSSRRQRLL